VNQSELLNGGGTTGSPGFSYNYCQAYIPTTDPPTPAGSTCWDYGIGAPAETWTFGTTASAADGASVTGTYLWTGNHDYFGASATLVAFTEYGGSTTILTATTSGEFNFTGTYTFTGLSTSETYGFYIEGANYDEFSSLQGTFTFTPSPPLPAPTGLIAIAGNDQVNLSWNAPSPSLLQVGQTVGDYIVLAGNTEGGESAIPAAIVSSTSAVITALPNSSDQLVPLVNGETYYFTVVAVYGMPTYGYYSSGTGPPAVSGAASSEVTATPELFQTNTSWLTAQPIPLSVSGSGNGQTGTASPAESIDLPGETLWYEIPVAPDEQVQAALSNVPADYNIALFSDINQTFEAETSNPNLLDLGAEAPGNAASPSAFSPSAFSPSAFSPSAFSPSAFSPSAFSPSAFSPSAFSPSAFSPSAFSPSAFSPSAFSPSAFSPSAFSPSAFSADYADAQTDSLLAVSTAPGAVNKSAAADTWNNTGNFYIRISGDNGAFDPGAQFTLTVTTSGSPCSPSISTNPDNLSGPLYQNASAGAVTVNNLGQVTVNDATSGTGYGTVVVDNSTIMPAAAQGAAVLTGATGQSDPTDLYTALRSLAGNALVDVGQNPWVSSLVSQAQGNAACPYAENLEASAIQDIINTYRTSTSSPQDVVIVGDDDVVPFFRYPDDAGLAPESGYEPPLSSLSAADASLQNNDYLSDDQYGAASELNIQGTTVPIANVPVGRLVETPSDIYNTVEGYLTGTTSINSAGHQWASLATGYDFMQAPASQVESAFVQGMGNGTNSTLISADGETGGACASGTPAGPNATLPCAWTAPELVSTLSGSHHDLVFLGAHFSANNLLAADDTTTLTTNQFAGDVGSNLQDSLVISPGCHSGFGIDTADAVPGVTDTLAWPQAFTEAGATLIAGTGYQYGDTNYVAYSDQLYVDLAQQLDQQPGASSGPVSVGSALLDSKLQYLAGLDQLTGLEEKALLQVTLYGLPMLGLQEPAQSAPAGPSSPITHATAVTSGPGQALSLAEADFPVTNISQDLTPEPAPSANAPYTYDSGPQGVTADPGGPVLPLLIDDVNAQGVTLRGVGFWGGTYSDAHGTTPLTGDPATDTGNSSLVQFTSPVFFPQTLWNPNYYPTLVHGGDTELALTPVQYESDSPTAKTDDMRTYDSLDLHLLYSSNTTQYACPGSSGCATGETYSTFPALAAPPTISDVSSVAIGDQVTVSAHVTGDPTAGIQEVWATYTDTSAGPLYGSWQSVDLTQSIGDGTLWSGTITDEHGGTAGNPATDMQLMVQAANGVGEVSMDNNEGYYFTPGVNPGSPGGAANSYQLSLSAPLQGPYEGTVSVSATVSPTTGNSLAPTVPGEDVTFDLGATTVSAPIVPNAGNSSGTATATIPLIQSPNTYTLSATYGGDTQDLPATNSASLEITQAATALSLSVPNTVVTGQNSGVTATLTTAGGAPLPQKPVYFVVSNGATVLAVTTGITSANGIAQAGVLDVPPNYTGTNITGNRVTAYFGTTVPLAGGNTYSASDPDFAAPTTSPSAGITVTEPLTVQLSAPSWEYATGTNTPVTYSYNVLNYDSSTAPQNSVTCNPSSGTAEPLGPTTINCSANNGDTGSATAVVDVVPTPIVFSVSGVQTYGSTPTWNYTASLASGGTPTGITGTLTCTTSPATNSSSPSSPIPYPLIINNPCSGLYIPAYYGPATYKGSLMIGAAPLTVTASSATITYGQAPPKVTPSYSSVNGATSPSLATPPTCSTTATQSSQPGTYATKCSGASDPNFSPISYVPGVLTITPSTVILLGSGTGSLTMSGQATASVHGSLSVNSASNGNANLSGQATLKATGTLISPAAKPVALSGQASTSLGSQETLAAETDPYASLGAPPTTGLTVYSSSTIQGPGVYTKAVTISGQSSITLASGTYVFDNGLALSGQASVKSAPGGVFLYFAGGALNISGQATAVLSPLASGADAGISLFQARTDNAAIVLSGQGHTTSMVGAMYAPDATIELSGQATLAVGGLIADDASLTGQGGLTVG
jgi:hypothetical protein